MTKRERIKQKFGGLCAYTGKPLKDDWQIDHVYSRFLAEYYSRDNVNDEANLIPTHRIINHYKRALDLEGFRDYMRTFHFRLARLPKNPKTEKTRKRIEYMRSIAELFDITPDKPFKGKFYFETI